MKNKTIILLVAILGILSACEKEEIKPKSEEPKVMMLMYEPESEPIVLEFSVPYPRNYEFTWIPKDSCDCYSTDSIKLDSCFYSNEYIKYSFYYEYDENDSILLWSYDVDYSQENILDMRTEWEWKRNQDSCYLYGYHYQIPVYSRGGISLGEKYYY